MAGAAFFEGEEAEWSRAWKPRIAKKLISIGDAVEGASGKNRYDCVVQELNDQTAKVPWPYGWTCLLVRAEIRRNVC